jgi:hypothetical protein
VRHLVRSRQLPSYAFVPSSIWPHILTFPFVFFLSSLYSPCPSRPLCHRAAPTKLPSVRPGESPLRPHHLTRRSRLPIRLGCLPSDNTRIHCLQPTALCVPCPLLTFSAPRPCIPAYLSRASSSPPLHSFIPSPRCRLHIPHPHRVRFHPPSHHSLPRTHSHARRCMQSRTTRSCGAVTVTYFPLVLLPSFQLWPHVHPHLP